MLAPAAKRSRLRPKSSNWEGRAFRWRDIRGRLKTPTMMQENGSLIVWHGQDKPLSSEFVRHLKRGGVADDEIVRWRADDIAKREPQLGGRFSDGIYLPTEGQLDGQQILSALVDALDGLNVLAIGNTNVPRRPASPIRLADRLPRLRRKTAWNQAPNTPALCAAYAAKWRGFTHPEITLNRPVRLLHPRYPLYIAPKENHIFVIGATQIESESRPRQRAFRVELYPHSMPSTRLRRSRHPRNRHRPAPHAQPPQPRNPLQPRPTPD